MSNRATENLDNRVLGYVLSREEIASVSGGVTCTPCSDGVGTSESDSETVTYPKGCPKPGSSSTSSQ